MITKEQEKLIRRESFMKATSDINIVEALRKRNANKKKLIELLEQTTKKASEKK